MGKVNGPYNADFPIGTKVRIKDTEVLEEFRRTWRYHDPISETQVTYAGRVSVVTWLGYYHGADELYALEGVPGTWHEQLLERA